MPSSFDHQGKGQASIPIARLQPSISPDTSTIVGQVALIWPYSSSKKSFGLLIVEPDFRLRRERGQVHVDFSGSSAKVVGRSGVKIGDEILLSLVGVEWAKDAATPRTPGDGIDWALCFRERLVLQLSRNSQKLTLLDIDHPNPSPEPPIRSPTRSPSTSLARTRSLIDSETGTQSWSSPAFLKRNQLPYATYLNTQYDPFRDESIFEDGGRRKKLRLDRTSYQWTFANKTPSPNKEGRLEVFESSRGTSPGLVGGEAADGTSTATLQLGSTEPKVAFTNDIGPDNNLTESRQDEAMNDEPARERLAEHDLQASFNVGANGHTFRNKETFSGVAPHKPPDRDADSESSIRQGPDGQELRPEPNDVNSQVEDMSRTLAEDRQSTPSRRDSLIRQQSPPTDATYNSSNGDPVNESPMIEDLDTQVVRSESSEVNVQNKDASQIAAQGHQATPIPRDSYIRRESPQLDATQNSLNRDSASTSPITQNLDRQELPSESSDHNMQHEDASPIVAEDHQPSPIRKYSSVAQDSPNHAVREPPDRDLDELSTTEGLDRREFRPETSDADMEDLEPSQIVPRGRQSGPVSRDSSISRDSLTNGATNKLPEQTINDDSLPEKGNDGQEFHSAADNDIVEEGLFLQVPPEDRPDPSAVEVSSPHRHSPLEDVEIKPSQRFKLSQPKRHVPPSESPESLASTDSTSQGSVADSQASVELVSEDDSSSARESTSDSSEAISTVSPLQSPYANLENLSYDQSDMESEDEVIYVGSNIHTPRENSPSSQVISSSEGYGSPNFTDEDIPSDKPGLVLDSLPVSLVRSTADNLPASNHKPEEVENSSPPPETVADDIEKSKHEPLATDKEEGPGPFGNMDADNVSPDEEIDKTKEENETQDMRPMTLYEDHANDIFRESHPIESEEESLSVQNLNRFSADVTAAESGGDDETDDKMKTTVLPKSTSTTSSASLDENRELEKDVSLGEEEFNISPDDDHSPPQRDNESQLVQAMPTVDIIDLESEGEDDIAATSPQVKVDPSQALVDFGKSDDVISEDGHVAKHEFERSSSEGHSDDQAGEQIDTGQAIHDAPTIATSIKDSEENVDLHTDQTMKQFSSRDSPTEDASEHMEIPMDYEHDSGVKHQDPGSSPQSTTSALEEALLGDANFDPILRSQLFTPLSSQQRSIKSEQSVFSEKNQQVEHELPTPRLTQSTSAQPLPPSTPEPQKKPSMIERVKAMKTLSAEKAHARKSTDYSKAANNWFTRKKPSQLTHVSDSEDERESGPPSDQVSIIDEERPEANPLLEPSGPCILTDETPQAENIISKPPPINGLRTSFAYYAPLSTLHSQFGALISVLTVVHSVDPIFRSKSGPRDFFQSLSLSDPSSMYYPPTVAQIFRPKEPALSSVNPGDAILLRNFKVQSFKNRLGLLSTDSSAWAVFRKGVEVQIRGPPVEFGPEERGFIKGLWKWWESVGAASVEKAIAEAGKNAATDSTSSVERKYVDKVDQRSKDETDPGKARTPRGAKGKVSGRTSSQIESDITPTPDSGRHELRDGTSYPDSIPEGRARIRPGAGVHELRDGTTYTGTDADADADSESNDGGRFKTKRGASAKPTPAAAEKDGKRVRRGTEKKKGEHELRDGTRYSDSLE